jgi:hypothetical protein
MMLIPGNGVTVVIFLYRLVIAVLQMVAGDTSE